MVVGNYEKEVKSAIVNKDEDALLRIVSECSVKINDVIKDEVSCSSLY